MGIDKFPQELYKSYRNYLMKRYYAFFHVFFLMEITKTEKKSHVFAVAPHAGAWIEMRLKLLCFIPRMVAPHAGAWIEILPGWVRRGPVPVAPHAGAWIEIMPAIFPYQFRPVAPHAGAWIEILPTSLQKWDQLSLPMRGRGLKSGPFCGHGRAEVSLPMRGRGLKYAIFDRKTNSVEVAPHAGAWIEISTSCVISRKEVSRSPCGGVD